MKIVTWNVNSLKARREYVELYLDSPDAPDVLGLQELKLTDEAVPRELFESRGYHLETFGQKQWNGVALASRWPLEDVERGLPAGAGGGGDEGQSRLIAATTHGVRVVNLYCPQGQGVDSPKFPYKLGFYDALIAWLGERIEPGEDWDVMGDLNVAREARDVWSEEALEGKPTYHPEEHRRWDQLLELGLVDAVLPYVEPGTFSFWDYRGAAFRFDHGFRIDHHLVTPAMAERVLHGWVDRPWRKKKGEHKASDHAPVGIELDAVP